MNENIGAIVESLIKIKDNYDLVSYETQAINLACNILDKAFNRLDAPESVFIIQKEGENK